MGESSAPFAQANCQLNFNGRFVLSLLIRLRSWSEN
jgi:hypothetical protein